MSQKENRDFGLLMAAFFLVLAGITAWRGGDYALGFAAISVLFGTMAIWAPLHLDLLRRAWLAFGRVMHAIVQPVLLAVVYYLVLAPMAVVRRKRLRFEREAPARDSYWSRKDPIGDFKRQF